MSDSLQSFASRLKQHISELTAAEKKVARVLLADYPVAGLEPVSRLAGRANVSAPTVLRLVTKFGYASYLEFQEQLRGEIAKRGASPIDQYEPASCDDTTLLGSALSIYRREIKHSFNEVDPQEFHTLIDLLADPKQRIWVLGGRYSRVLADYFVSHLRLMRENVRFVDISQTSQSLALLDIGARDLVVVFDYRRYQNSAVKFAERAHAHRAKVIVFTDQWLSPAAKYADLVYSSSVTAPSAFDSLVPALALIETVVAAVLQQLGSSALARIQAFDAWEE